MATKQQIEALYKRSLSPREEAMRRIDDLEERKKDRLLPRIIVRHFVDTEKVQGPGPFQDNF